MSDTTRENLDLDDEDRLPWLESAEDYDDDGEYSPIRVALFVGAGLLLLAAIVGGIYWLQNRDGGGLDGDGELIAAQEGDYKVRPDDPQARQFEGEGDASAALSTRKRMGKVGFLHSTPGSCGDRAKPVRRNRRVLQALRSRRVRSGR